MASAMPPEMMNHRHHAALASASRWSPSWGSAISQSFRQAEADDPFRRAQSVQEHDKQEENLRWAALEKLPTYDRMRRGVVRSTLLHDHQDGPGAAATVKAVELVDIGRLGAGDAARALVDRLLQDDSERFLRRLRDRIDMVGIELPKIEIRYEQLSVQADSFVASRALPTLSNATSTFSRDLLNNLVPQTRGPSIYRSKSMASSSHPGSGLMYNGGSDRRSPNRIQRIMRWERQRRVAVEDDARQVEDYLARMELV